MVGSGRKARKWTVSPVLMVKNGQFFNIDNFLLDSPVVETMFATVTDIELGKINVNKIYQSTAGHIWALTNKSLFQFRKNKWVGHFKNEGECLHIDR